MRFDPLDNAAGAVIDSAVVSSDGLRGMVFRADFFFCFFACLASFLGLDEAACDGADEGSFAWVMVPGDFD